MNKENLIYGVDNNAYFVYAGTLEQGAARKIASEFDYGNKKAAKELRKAYDRRGKEVRINLLKDIINVSGIDGVEFVYENKLSKDIRGLLNEAIAKDNINKAVKLKQAYDNRTKNLVDFLTGGVDNATTYTVGTAAPQNYKTAIKYFVENNDTETAKKTLASYKAKIKGEYNQHAPALLENVDDNTEYFSSKNKAAFKNAAYNIERYLKAGELGAAKRINKDYTESAKKRVTEQNKDIVELIKAAKVNNKFIAAGATVPLNATATDEDLVALVYANRCDTRDGAYLAKNCPVAQSLRTYFVEVKAGEPGLEAKITKAYTEADFIPCEKLREKVKGQLQAIKSYATFAEYGKKAHVKFATGPHATGTIASDALPNGNEKNLAGVTRCELETQLGDEVFYLDGFKAKEVVVPQATMSGVIPGTLMTVQNEGSIKPVSQVTSVADKIKNFLKDNVDVHAWKDRVARMFA